MRDRDIIKLLGVLTAFICMILILSGCSVKPKNEVQTYKVQIGKKCTVDGDVFSFIWLHTVYGPQVVHKKYCN